MKGISQGNAYALLSTTVNESAATAITCSGGDPYEFTRLGHRHLLHMSEKDQNYLGYEGLLKKLKKGFSCGLYVSF